MKRLICLGAAAALALAVGCVPERVVWSPDGSRALVLGDDGVHFCDMNGKLSAPLTPSASAAAWTPDGKHMVAAIEITLKTWDEVSKAFPKEAADAAKNADAVQEQLLTVSNGWGPFLSDTQDKLHLTQQQVELAVMELRDHDTQGMIPKLNDLMRKSVVEQTLIEETVQLFNAGDGAMTPGPVLLRWTRDPNGGAHSIRVSPSGALAAVTIDQNKDNNNDKPDELLVVPTDGSGKTCDLGMAAAYPDWSEDGKYVVYIRPANWHQDDKDILSLGVLSQREVLDDKGNLSDTEHLPKAEDLAGMTFDGWARVQVVKDGRIFFSAMELSLPVTPADVPTQGTIFCYDYGRAATLGHVEPRAALDTLGNAPNYFEVSPDARYISIPYSDGRVSVLDIAIGNAKVVQWVAEGNGKDLKLQSVPTWRTATELTFIEPSDDLKRHEIVRYSVPDATKTVMSGGWPEGTLDVLTKAPEPVTQPSQGMK
jgi:hypothetical protein